MDISTHADLLALIDGIASDTINIDKINVSEELIFTIKLKGEKWDGLVDYEVANFVIQIQKQIDELYKQLAFEDPRYKRIPKHISELIKVKVKVDFGCSIFNVKLGKVLSELLKTMTGKEKIILISSVCFIICASLVGYSYIDSQNELEKLKQIHNDNREVIKVLDKAIDKLGASYTPMSSLVESMEEKDEIVFKNTGSAYPAHTIKMKIKPHIKKEVIKTNYYADDQYEILRIYKDSDEASLIIDGFQFFASTGPLSDADKAKLHDVFKEAHVNKKAALLNLRVGISVESQKLREAFIVGIGEKRTDSVSILDVLEEQPLPKTDDLPLIKLSKQ